MAAPERDVVTIGRVSVDLYGQQIGGRLEDMTSFAKSVGGSPANMAIGAARLGLKTGFVSRVGDEAMGRFIREQMQREGVDTRHLKTDPSRLTALVLLGVRDERTFPLIFYRESCADNALDEGDIDEGYIASARAVVVTGTHFALSNTDAAQRKAMRIAKAHARKVVLDIDYRPNLWGLAGHGAGDARYIASGRVSQHIQGILPSCDLIVGTEEEIRIAGGVEDTHAALRMIRELSAATIVLKRGPMGCVVLDGGIPDDLSAGIVGEGFPVEVYNVLGAGDAFMAGFLSSWLRDRPLIDCARRANACGAIAVSRLLCSPEYATSDELEHFLANGCRVRALRHDPVLTHLHRVTTRRPLATPLVLLDIAGLLDLADNPARLCEILIEVATRHANTPAGIGVILDDRSPNSVLHRATGLPLTVLRRPSLSDHEAELIAWPARQTALLDAAASTLEALTARGQFFHRLGHEVAVLAAGGVHVLREVDALYGAGFAPDWWIVPVATSGIAEMRDAIARYDPHCRGILVTDGPAPVARASGAVVGAREFGPLVQRWSRRDMDDRGLAEAAADLVGKLEDAWIAQGRESRRRSLP